MGGTRVQTTTLAVSDEADSEEFLDSNDNGWVDFNITNSWAKF
jgi:hypothetical protein